MTLAEYIATLAKSLGLSEWEIELEEDDLSDDVLARCTVPRARQFATIRIGSEFKQSSPEDKRSTLVHELLHCHFTQVQEITYEALPTIMGRPAYAVFDAAHELALERCLDAIAVAISPSFPLPPEEE